MAFTPISLLLLRRSSIAKRYVNSYLFFNNNNNILKPYSTSTATDSQQNPISVSSSSSSILEEQADSSAKPSNLSSRLSFVFDQIDAIERDRSEKDDALQRIRAWRESKNSKKLAPDQEPVKSRAVSEDSREVAAVAKKEVELVHPWPEWVELMERLVQQNYFDHKRKDEDKMVEDSGFDMSDVVEEGFDFTRDLKTVVMACLDFGRDRFDILRSLSRQDIQVLVGYGCPSADRKVTYSGKLLRKYVHLDEGDVCSSCSLRSSCERAYLTAIKEDEARTTDIMRVLLTYAFDPINGSVTNSSLLKKKTVKTVIRKLLHQIVKLSAVPIDPSLPPPVFKKPPPKVKQAPPPPRKRVGRDDVEMKKGDWLCPKCEFMNFAKNTVCLQCDAKAPKRQLLPGEWECPECKFLNYRRNTDCFHCECRRPPDEYTENLMQEKPRGARTSLEKVASRQEVSSAWNFDFDDDESDGAEVAAFEYADTPRMGDDFPMNVRSQGGIREGPQDGFGQIPFNHERRDQSAPNRNRPGNGFDDFDDEEQDDDIDSYEVDTHNELVRRPLPTEEFSDEDLESHSASKPFKRVHPKTDFSGSEDDDLDINFPKDLPVHPNWKSSHVTNPRERRTNGPPRGLSLGSDADDDSDDDFGSRKSKNVGPGFKSNRPDFKSKRRSDSEDSSLDSDSSDDDDQHSYSSRGNKFGRNRGGNSFKGRKVGFVEDSGYGSDDDYDRSSRGGRGGGSRGDDYGGQRKNDRSDNMRTFNGSKRGDTYGDRERGSGRNDFNPSSRGGRGGGGSGRGGFKGGDYGGQRNDRTDNTRSFNGSRRGDTYGDKERGSRRNDRGEVSSRREGYGNRDHGGRTNDRGDSPRNFNGSKREGHGSKQRGGKFADNDGDQSFGDDRPRRVRIIER